MKNFHCSFASSSTSCTLRVTPSPCWPCSYRLLFSWASSKCLCCVLHPVGVRFKCKTLYGVSFSQIPALYTHSDTCAFVCIAGLHLCGLDSLVPPRGGATWNHSRESGELYRENKAYDSFIYCLANLHSNIIPTLFQHSNLAKTLFQHGGLSYFNIYILENIFF